MPRQRAQPPQTDRALLNNEVIAADQRAVDADAPRRTEITQRFGDGIPYERNVVVSTLRFHLQTGAQAMLEAGKCLVHIKEFEQHADYLEIVEAMGLSESSARRMMAAAVKFLLSQSAKGREPLLALGPSKLYDLAMLDDDQLDELAKGGSVFGINLEASRTMSVREMRAALKERDADLAAKDRVIEGKDKKINKLLEADAGGPFRLAFDNALRHNSDAFDKLQLACAEVARVAESIADLEFPEIESEKDALALRAQIANHFYGLSEFWLEQGAGLVVSARADFIEGLISLAKKRLPEDVKAKIFGGGQ